MKKMFAILILLCVSLTFAQAKHNVKLEKEGDRITATYYHDNGEVAQKGTFNNEGQLHGVWTSFDLNGKKVSVGNYDNGKKVGKWLFWTDDILKEVDYVDSKIASVQEWTNKEEVALRN